MSKSDWKEKIHNITKDISLDKIKTFCKKNWRYFAAAALFVVLILIMVKCSSRKDAKNDLSTEGTNGVLEEYKVDAVPEVNELMSSYYTAYAEGDFSTLETLITPMPPNEQSFIAMFSQYVDAYENLKCYTKPGLDDTSYLVSVYSEVRFTGVDTLAPGLEFFYVRTNEEGRLYIDNLYSNYNRLHQELETDPAIDELVNLFRVQKDVVALQADVQNKYEEALASDARLAEMVNVTIKDAYAAWAATLAKQPSTEQVPSTEQIQETEQPSTEEAPPATEEAPQEPVATAETVYTIDKVNIRQEANETSSVLGQAERGTAFTRTGTTDDGWSCIDYNGTPAYVKSDYLSTEAPAAEEPVSGIPEGTVVNLTNTVNVRSSMSETADKVGVAYAGDSVTVIMSYSEGWTKVTWNNKTGYVKTEYLK